jgi:hypothetical protein
MRLAECRGTSSNRELLTSVQEERMQTRRWGLAVLLLILPLAVGAQGKGKGIDEYLRVQAFMNAPPTAEATASRLLINPFGDVDGVLLDNGTIVTFPPHMGEQLAAAVRAGDTLLIKGYPEKPTQIKGYVIVNKRSNQTVAVQPKPKPAAKIPKHLRSIGLKEMSAEGEVRHVRYGGHGDVNGLILSDGTILRFPREIAHRFAGLFQVGQRIVASGYGTENEFGRAIEVTALAPQGQTPQPLYGR